MQKIQAMVLLVALLASACNTEGTKSQETRATAQSQGPTAKGAASKEADGTESNAEKSEVAKIRLVLSGGEMAGTYEASCMDAGCSHGLAGEEVFGLQYSETGKGDKELSSVQMIIPEVAGNRKTTNKFMVTISFGDLLEGKSYTISTLREGNSRGSGTLELNYADEKANVKINGVTQEGYKIDLSIECHRVLTTENMREALGK